MPELISSHANPLIKLIRSLRQHKGRAENDLFLVEGIAHVGQAIEAGWEIQTLVYAPEFLTSSFGLDLVDQQTRRGLMPVALTGSLFSDVAEKENPQGLLAIVRQRHTGFADLDLSSFRWGAACVAPQDPGNVGTILRTLDAVGADGLFLLDGGVELYHPSVVRASMGALFWKPAVQSTFEAFAAWALQTGFELVGSSAHASMDYREFRRGGRKTILLLGSEQKGLSDGQLAACKVNLAMPMRGRVSSLNLAVAAGILLYSLQE